MQKLTSVELAQEHLKQPKMKTNPKVVEAFQLIATLAVGEAVKILSADWPRKNTPANAELVRQTKIEGARFSTRQLADNSGFVIIRTK